ncbi:hypothetical protein BY996DRAFT_4579280, partial [Phakopsora pachyrhizi]
DKCEIGKPYLAADAQLVKDRLRLRPLIQKYNSHPWPTNEAEDPDPDYFGPDDRRLILAEIFGLQIDDIKNKPIEIEPPFYCDYGTNTIFKGPFYSNFNFHILDCATVTFGSRVICGPNVHIYAATHSTDVSERKKGLERAYPVVVGDDVWIGGGAIIIGPCNIGSGTTVAAGAVVRGDVPPNVVIGGVPGRVIKNLTERSSVNGKQPIIGDSSLSKLSRLGGPKGSKQATTITTAHITSMIDEADRSQPASQQSEEVIDPATECFLANIPPDLTTSVLQEALSAYGEVLSLTLDRTRRLGFVRFDSTRAAEEAVQAGRRPDGLVITIDENTKERMVVGIERRRISITNRTFNPDLITSTKCLIRRVPSTVDFDELRELIESKAGRLIDWSVQDFTSPDPAKITTDKFVSMEFEQLGAAREAVRLSQVTKTGTGGLEVPGSDGVRVRVEAKKLFSTYQSRPPTRGSYNPFHHSRGGGYSYRGIQSARNYSNRNFSTTSTKWKPRRNPMDDFMSSQE